MFVQVQLLNGFSRTFLYSVPKNLESRVQEGVIVNVPLRDKFVGAVVVKIEQKLSKKIGFAVKAIAQVEPLPDDPSYQNFINKIAAYSFIKPIHFAQRIRSFLKEQKKSLRKKNKTDKTDTSEKVYQEVQLTKEQQAPVDYLSPFVKDSEFKPTVVHGVTGSGKTEVYKALIEEAVLCGKSVILLLPEVTLALQFERLFKKRLKDIPVFGFHTGTKITEKRELWHGLLEGTPMLIIGVHLPIMLPVSKLGLIIIDEEHETGFTEKNSHKLNSKEIALWRAKLYNIPILLGSATPAISTLYNVEKHGWKLFKILRRFSGQFPSIQKVLLPEKKEQRKHFWVSQKLEKAVRETLARKEQVIVYLNRRGFSFFVQCKSCGFLFECPHCSVSLTLHRIMGAQGVLENKLCCHYCEFSQLLPRACPSCKAKSSELVKKGIGTQQVVDIFTELFPRARIARADLDTTKKKREWESTVEAFERGELDILIGTKSVTKGYHFPGVTLVGILWADLNLHFPHYNAAETTLQQIIQVAGRAGRDRDESTVIIQVMDDHQVFDFVSEDRYPEFYRQELEMRQVACYPPCVRLASIELRNKNVFKLERDANKLRALLDKLNAQFKLDLTVRGPSMPAIYKIQNYEMRHFTIKSASFQKLHQLLASIDEKAFDSEIFMVTSQQ